MGLDQFSRLPFQYITLLFRLVLGQQIYRIAVLFSSFSRQPRGHCIRVRLVLPVSAGKEAVEHFGLTQDLKWESWTA